MISVGTFITDTFMPAIIFMVTMNVSLLLYKLIKRIPGSLDFILTAAIVDGFIICWGTKLTKTILWFCRHLILLFDKENSMIKILMSFCIYFGAIFIPAFIVYAIRKYIRRRKIKMLAAKYEPRILMPENMVAVTCMMHTSHRSYAEINAYYAILSQWIQYKERVIRNLNEGDKEKYHE